jgi:Glycosyl transferases group 1
VRSSSIRILMINDHIHFGGGGDAVFRLERSCYEDAGFEVFTFSQANERPLWASDRDFIAIERRSRVLKKAGKFLASPSVSRSFRQSLQIVRPHFISVHLVSKYPTSVYSQLRGYPVVQTLHGPNLFCVTSWGSRKDGTPCELGVGVKCCTRGCASLAETGLYMFLYKRLLASIKRSVDLFVCPSQHIRESSESLGFTPAEFIPLGIDNPFITAEASSHDGSPKVLYVGALIEEKGVHVLLEAFQSVVARVPEAQLQIAGRGVMADALRKQAVHFGLTKNVEFLGFVERSKIVDLYQHASVFVVPSIYKEQFGLVGPEALACGVPCVGSNCGGIPEWLHDGEWGFTVPPRDPGALAARIVTLLENRDLRRQFGARGRAWAVKRYSPDRYREDRLRLVEKYANTAK